MIGRLRITVLADNYVAGRDQLGEHGLSMLVEADDRRILFDTGQGQVLRHNLATLGITLAPLDAVVLSHGHYDHTGGLPVALAAGSPRAIFMHPAVTTPKFVKRERLPFRSIGIPASSTDALHPFQDRVVWTRTCTQIAPSVWCTGEIPRQRNGDAAAEQFFLDEGGREPDPLLDDQALFVETRRGLVVLAGCAHAGVVNTVNRVCELAGQENIHALVGGLHLRRASVAELDEAARSIDQRCCRLLAPCHCTGMTAQSYLRARFHSIVQDVGVGTVVVVDHP